MKLMLSKKSLCQEERYDIMMNPCNNGIDVFVDNRSFIGNLFDRKVKVTEDLVDLYNNFSDLEWFIAKFMEYCSSKDYYMTLEAFMLTSHLYKGYTDRGVDFVKVYNSCRKERSKVNIRYLLAVTDREHKERIVQWFAKCERFELDYSKPENWTYNNTL